MNQTSTNTIFNKNTIIKSGSGYLHGFEFLKKPTGELKVFDCDCNEIKILIAEIDLSKYSKNQEDKIIKRYDVPYIDIYIKSNFMNGLFIEVSKWNDIKVWYK